jgi:hypothetical protein
MLSLFIDYTKWHYTHAIVGIFRLTREYVRFLLNLFSVALFLRTLFLPIFSIPIDDMRSLDIPDMIATFLASIIIRIVGALARSLLIILGLSLSMLTCIFFATLFVLWVFLPGVFIMLLYYLLVFSFSIL